MKTVEVTVQGIPNSSYPIHLGKGAIAALPKEIEATGASKVLLVVDQGMLDNHPAIKNLPYNLFALAEQGEDQKTFSSISKVEDIFVNNRLDRRSLVVAIGGGATGDAVGFAASIYMRGIRWINVPTTLLSQVDSSIGGKTGINVGSVKNSVGSFWSPSAVIIDYNFLTTLPEREFRSGCAEILKHAAIMDRELFSELEKVPIIGASTSTLGTAIEKSITIKKGVVTDDPYEKGKRKILNFGHTVGHALEALSHKTQTPLLHGEAIAMGMVAEAVIGERVVSLSPAVTTRLKNLFSLHGLPTSVPAFEREKILSVMEADKKNDGGDFRFSIITDIGSCAYDVSVPKNIVADCLDLL